MFNVPVPDRPGTAPRYEAIFAIPSVTAVKFRVYVSSSFEFQHPKIGDCEIKLAAHDLLYTRRLNVALWIISKREVLGARGEGGRASQMVKQILCEQILWDGTQFLLILIWIAIISSVPEPSLLLQDMPFTFYNEWSTSSRH